MTTFIIEKIENTGENETQYSTLVYIMYVMDVNN